MYSVQNAGAAQPTAQRLCRNKWNRNKINAVNICKYHLYLPAVHDILLLFILSSYSNLKVPYYTDFYFSPQTQVEQSLQKSPQNP